MAHKFRVGDLVSFKAIGQKLGLYKVVRQMPEEFPAADWKYRIKSEQEDFERTVLECDLSPSIIPEQVYEPVKPLRRAGLRKLLDQSFIARERRRPSGRGQQSERDQH